MMMLFLDLSHRVQGKNLHNGDRLRDSGIEGPRGIYTLRRKGSGEQMKSTSLELPLDGARLSWFYILRTFA